MILVATICTGLDAVSSLSYSRIFRKNTLRISVLKNNTNTCICYANYYNIPSREKLITSQTKKELSRYSDTVALMCMKQAITRKSRQF